MQWEYALLIAEYNGERKDYPLNSELTWKTTFKLRGPTGTQKIEDPDGELFKVLNRLGQAGWEAWQQGMFNHHNGTYSQESIWLKRPVPTSK